MGRGRPKKYSSGSIVWSGSLPASLVRKLREMPNASDWVATVLTVALGSRCTDLISAEISQADKELLALKREILTIEKNKAGLEELLRGQQTARDTMLEARQGFLERVITGKGPNAGPKTLGWYQSRTDILAECGFEDAEVAMRWQEEAIKNWRR